MYTKLFRASFVLLVITALHYHPSMTRAQSSSEDILVNLIQYAKNAEFFLGTTELQTYATNAGYEIVENEGFALAVQLPGTIPLKLYSTAKRDEFFTLANAQSESEAISGGYTFVRTVGYIYPTPQANTVALRLQVRRSYPLPLDYRTTKGPNFPQYASSRVEGYVFQSLPLERIVLFSSPGGDYRTDLDRRQPAGYASSGKVQYWDACIFNVKLPGTVALRLFYSTTRRDSFTTASKQGEADAKAAGYQELSILGYVFATNVGKSIPLYSLWNSQKQENVTTTPVNSAVLAAAGYTLTRTEGYVFAPSQCSPL